MAVKRTLVKASTNSGRINIDCYTFLWKSRDIFIYTDIAFDADGKALEKTGNIYISRYNIHASKRKTLTPFKGKLTLIGMNDNCPCPTISDENIKLVGFKPGLTYTLTQLNKDLLVLSKKTYVLQRFK